MKDPDVRGWSFGMKAEEFRVTCRTCRVVSLGCVSYEIPAHRRDVCRAREEAHALRATCRCEPIVELKDFELGARVCRNCERIAIQCNCGSPSLVVVAMIDRNAGTWSPS